MISGPAIVLHKGLRVRANMFQNKHKVQNLCLGYVKHISLYLSILTFFIQFASYITIFFRTIIGRSMTTLAKFSLGASHLQ